MTWLLLFYTACTESKDSAEPSEALSAGWSHVFEEDVRGAFMSIWEAQPGDIWAVGGQEGAGFVVRGAKDTWEELDVPPQTPLLNWVHGTSQNDVWVGGLAGTLLHWDGSAWSDYSIEMDEAIWGIYANSETSVIAVGGESRWGGSVAKILSLKDGGFVEVDLPEPLSELGNLFKVSCLDDVFWAVGAQGALLYGDENGFSAVGTGLAADLITIVHSSDRLHVVGGRGTGLYFEVKNGVAQEPMQLPAGINGVAASDSGTLLVGERGYTALLEDDALEEQTSVTFDVLHAALVDSQGEHYAVGGNLFTAESFFHGTFLHWTQQPAD